MLFLLDCIDFLSQLSRPKPRLNPFYPYDCCIFRSVLPECNDQDARCQDPRREQAGVCYIKCLKNITTIIEPKKRLQGAEAKTQSYSKATEMAVLRQGSIVDVSVLSIFGSKACNQLSRVLDGGLLAWRLISIVMLPILDGLIGDRSTVHQVF